MVPISLRIRLLPSSLEYGFLKREKCTSRAIFAEKFIQTYLEDKVLPVPRGVPARRRQGMPRGRMCGIPLCFSEKSQVFTFAGDAERRRCYPGSQRRVRHQLHPGLCAVRKKICYSVLDAHWKVDHDPAGFSNSSGNSRNSHFSGSRW